MTTTAVSTTTTAPPPRPTGYAVTVRRARSLLRALLLLIAVGGVITTVTSFLAMQDALNSYRRIVADSAVSADAAQEARASLLAHHSASADFLSQQGSPNADSALQRGQDAWLRYQEEVRRIWQNRTDEQFGEFAVFDAADRGTLRYRAGIDAMIAFARSGDIEQAQNAFLGSHDILVREVVPALNGIESLKLESMEAAYATTNASVSRWQQLLLILGGAAVALLLLSFLLTRFWLHYGWTWELALASAVGILLFAWFNYSLIYAATEVEVLVRDAYDTISGAQSVEALLTQADALESMAIFDPAGAAGYLRDADQYLFLLEQQLCGERACTDETFLVGQRIDPNVEQAALTGQNKYGLPRTPLVANASFGGEPQALETLRTSIQRFRIANDQLDSDLTTSSVPSEGHLSESRDAYTTALTASQEERSIARDAFDQIYATVTFQMELNRWLALLFTALAVLGYWGLRRRREALFA